MPDSEVTAFVCFLFITFCSRNPANSHPICVDDSDPTHRSAGAKKFKLCKQFEYYGCCDANKEYRIYERYLTMITHGVSGECSEMLREMLCQQCSPLAGHIFLTEYYYQNQTQSVWPALCEDYCYEFYEKCNETIKLPTQSKDDFCAKLKAVDEYYCYPYVNHRKEENQEITPGCIKMCLEEVANSLFQPMTLKSATDGTNRFFVLEQRGYIWTYLANRSKIAHPPFLNITDRILVNLRKYDVRGLTDFTFHPRFKENGLIYVYYAHGYAKKLYTRISQFKVSEENMNMVDAASEIVVLDIKQDTEKHNGGSLLFGPDGFLYFGFGDGGHLSDGLNRGQIMNTLLGKMIRIDIEPMAVNGTAYDIPADNPHADRSNKRVRPEIFASGLRNPWRCSMDRGDPFTGDKKGRIFCGDVGSSDVEEINVIEKGKNYGWRIMEGSRCSPKSRGGECTEQTMENLTKPIMEYGHDEMNCIIGGYVYRGCKHPALQGVYIASALKRRGLRALKEEANGTWTRKDICLQTKKICGRNGMKNKYPHSILSLSEDLDGELYVLSTETPGPGFNGGRIHKLVHTPDNPSLAFKPSQCSSSPISKETVLAPGTELEHYKPIPSLKVRLMNGNETNRMKGRLEVRLENEVWGTVCGRIFSTSAANIACNMMPGVRKIGLIQHNITTYGKGSGRIWLKNLNCQGHERSLFNCYHDGWGNVGNCTHDEDVFLECNIK